MRVPAIVGLLTVGLSAQSSVGKMQISFEPMSPVNQEGGRYDGAAVVLQALTDAYAIPQAHVVTRGDNRLYVSGIVDLPGHRHLADVDVIVRISDLDPSEAITLRLKIFKPDGPSVVVDILAVADADGSARVQMVIDMDYLNEDFTDVCNSCALEEEIIECPRTSDCDEITDNVLGDSHMVSLLGQKINWAGVDNAWYCLLSYGPDFHLNIRVSVPMPEEFPDRKLISAVSILTDDGLQSLVVEVKNPYSTNTDGCPKDSPVPCLADGGLRILVDGEEQAALHAPSENVRLPGSYPVIVSTANLPAECRPCDGGRIWATQFADSTTNRRNLRSDAVAFEQWILQPDNLAAPTWCDKFLEERGSAGLLFTRSEHATLRVETPLASVRINVGVNYQDLETAPDGTMLVPELEFWQTDVNFDGLLLSNNVAGLMGDTSRFVSDDKEHFVLGSEGRPVLSGPGTLHGPVESYRVAGPFDRDFEKLHRYKKQRPPGMPFVRSP